MNPLKKWRKAQGWTQKEVSDFLGTTREAVSKWELGKATPRPNMFLAIAELIGIHPGKLLGKWDGAG